MTSPSKRKGDAADREVAGLLSDLLGMPVRRKLGAGRMDDEGDLEGIDDWTLEVKNRPGVVVDDVRCSGCGRPYSPGRECRIGGECFR